MDFAPRCVLRRRGNNSEPRERRRTASHELKWCAGDRDQASERRVHQPDTVRPRAREHWYVRIPTSSRAESVYTGACVCVCSRPTFSVRLWVHFVFPGSLRDGHMIERVEHHQYVEARPSAAIPSGRERSPVGGGRGEAFPGSICEGGGANQLLRQSGGLAPVGRCSAIFRPTTTRKWESREHQR